MATLAVTNAFVNGAANDGPQVTANFTDVTTFVNANCIQKDGSVALTALLTGPATDPTSDNHLARKKYVDDRVGMTAGNMSVASDTNNAVNAYQDVGTIISVTNPAKAVNVHAWASGFVQNVAFNSQINLKIGVSFDNGGTYSEAQQFITTDASHNYYYPFSLHYFRTGTPTNTVKIRLQHLGKDVANIVTWEPLLSYQMYKSVTI